MFLISAGLWKYRVVRTPEFGLGPYREDMIIRRPRFGRVTGIIREQVAAAYS
jgi:hypothetical protein